MNKYIVSEEELYNIHRMIYQANSTWRSALANFLKSKTPVKPLNRENVSDLIDKHMVVDGLAVAHGMGKSIESPAPICLYNNKQVDDFITGILNLTPEPSGVLAKPECKLCKAQREVAEFRIKELEGQARISKLNQQEIDCYDKTGVIIEKGKPSICDEILEEAPLINPEDMRSQTKEENQRERAYKLKHNEVIDIGDCQRCKAKDVKIDKLEWELSRYRNRG